MKNAAVALVLLMLASAAPAQDAALVRKLLTVSGAEKQYDQMMSIMMGSVRTGFNKGFNDALKDKPIDAVKRERAEAIAARHAGELERDIVADVRRVMPFENLVGEVYTPLYGKTFTAAELRDAIAFFKSPAGRKFVSATPQLMQDSARIVNERYGPQLNQAISRRMEAHMKLMVEELKKL